MVKAPPKLKWHKVSSTAAKRLIEQTATPGLVYPVDPNAIPTSLKNIKGINDFYVSSYAVPIQITPGISAGGEIAAIRHEGDTAKAYNYLIGTSSNGQVCFTGPYKGFDQHHFASSTCVPIEVLFGNPLAKGGLKR